MSWRSLPVVWVLKAPFSPVLAFSVVFHVGLGGHQPLPLSSPTDWDAGSTSWFGYLGLVWAIVFGVECCGWAVPWVSGGAGVEFLVS